MNLEKLKYGQLILKEYENELCFIIKEKNKNIKKKYNTKIKIKGEVIKIKNVTILKIRFLVLEDKDIKEYITIFSYYFNSNIQYLDQLIFRENLKLLVVNDDNKVKMSLYIKNNLKGIIKKFYKIARKSKYTEKELIELLKKRDSYFNVLYVTECMEIDKMDFFE